MQFRFKYFVQDWLEIEGLVHQNAIWTIIPSFFAQDKRNYWILPVPEQKEHEYSIYLYYRKDYAKLTWFKKIVGQILNSQ